MNRSCLEEELLAGYLEGDLSEREKAKVENHLADCDTCLQAIIISNTMVKQADAAQLQDVPKSVTAGALELIKAKTQPLTEPLKDKIKQSTKGLLTTMSDMVSSLTVPQPKLAPVRGGRTQGASDKAMIVKAFNGLKAEIEIEKKAYGKAYIKIAFPESGGQSDGVRVTLKKNDREVSSFLVDSTRQVVFEDIPLDRYSLVFLKAGEMLGTYFFVMKE